MSKFNASTTTAEVLSGISLKGRTVLITGASTGLGLASAIALAQVGAKLILTARSEAKFLAAKDAVLVTTTSTHPTSHEAMHKADSEEKDDGVAIPMEPPEQV